MENVNVRISWPLKNVVSCCSLVQDELVLFFFVILSDRRLWLPSQSVSRAMSSSDGPTSPYTTLAISHPAESVTHVELHRPEKRNAMNIAFWRQESTQNTLTQLLLFTYSVDMFNVVIRLLKNPSEQCYSPKLH